MQQQQAHRPASRMSFPIDCSVPLPLPQLLLPLFVMYQMRAPHPTDKMCQCSARTSVLETMVALVILKVVVVRVRSNDRPVVGSRAITEHKFKCSDYDSMTLTYGANCVANLEELLLILSDF